MRNTIFYFGILGALIFIGVSVWGGLRLEGYNEIRQYISETYATGIPGAGPIRYGFVLSGILMALFAFMSPSVLPRSKGVKGALWGFGIFYGLGTVITGLFPCDLGCNPGLVDPSIAQLIHNLSASLTYMIVPFCLLAIALQALNWPEGRKMALVTFVCTVMASIFVLLLFSDPYSGMKGLYQRITEAGILLWVIYMAFYIKKQRL